MKGSYYVVIFSRLREECLRDFLHNRDNEKRKMPRILILLLILSFILYEANQVLSSKKHQLPKDCGRVLANNKSRSQIETGLSDVIKGHNVPSFVVMTPVKSPKDPIVDQTSKGLCSGTILSNRLILTSAKCLKKLVRLENAINILVTSNSSTKGMDTLFRSAKFCASRRNHDMYSHASHDIAIVQVEKTIPFSDRVQPACLPGVSESLPDKDGLFAYGLNDTAQVNEIITVAHLPVNISSGKNISSKKILPDYVDLELIRLPVEERDCPSEIYHPSIACFSEKKGPPRTRARKNICKEWNHNEPEHQGGPVYGGIESGKHTVYGVLSQSSGANCSIDKSSLIQAANLIYLRRELIELVERCSPSIN